MDKLKKLEEIIRGYGSLGVAFSGGVDSTFLLHFAHKILGEKVIAITAKAVAFSNEEMQEAEDFCKTHGIRHVKVDLAWEELAGFVENPPNRCYICKKAIFGKLSQIAADYGVTTIADGTNADDILDYRPGMKALEELGIQSPLKDAGLTKSEIRIELKEQGLSVWNKPAYACLATRVPYGEEITPEKLKSIGGVEEELHQLGFLQVRVRHHGNVARIEVLPEERQRFFDLELMNRVNRIVLNHGFQFAALDLAGYKMGNLNVNQP